MRIPQTLSKLFQALYALTILPNAMAAWPLNQRQRASMSGSMDTMPSPRRWTLLSNGRQSSAASAGTLSNSPVSRGSALLAAGLPMKRVLPLLFFGFLAAPGHAAETVEQESFRAAVDKDGIQRVAIAGGNYFFKPSRIVVKVNVPVEFAVSKEPGIVPHTFVIDAPEAGIAIDATLGTEPQIVAFTPKKPGQYPFFCKNRLLFFKSHREHGMEGVLEVVE